tara:strand:+ start:1961 stop:2458 length:498 start_codon:yes stop_codon:yes gene_type:complete
MNLLDKLIQSLNKTTESIQPQPDCWIGNYPNDNHDGDFCRSCCQKHVDTLLSGFHPSTEDDVKSTPLNKSELEAIEFAPPFVDGGWGSENDRLPICITCGGWITSTLTDSTVISELEHYIQHADSIDLSQPNQAYGLLIVLDGVYSEKSIELQNILLEKLKFSLF